MRGKSYPSLAVRAGQQHSSTTTSGISSSEDDEPGLVGPVGMVLPTTDAEGNSDNELSEPFQSEHTSNIDASAILA